MAPFCLKLGFPYSYQNGTVFVRVRIKTKFPNPWHAGGDYMAKKKNLGFSISLLV
jgi:hypothetical protein